MDGKKRILMIADADSFWTRRLMEHLLLPAGYELVLFPIWGDGGKYVGYYSGASAPVTAEPATVGEYGDSEFLLAVAGKDPARAWAVVDELMDTLSLVNRKVYDSMLRKIKSM